MSCLKCPFSGRRVSIFSLKFVGVAVWVVVQHSSSLHYGKAINWIGTPNKESRVSRAGETMATELRIKPPFEVLSEYPVPLSAKEVYTNMNKHHGDQFGKCKITAGSPLKRGTIRMLVVQKQHT